MFLNGGSFEAELGGDGSDGAGVVGLNTADGDEGVAALGESFRGEVSIWKKRLVSWLGSL